MLWPRSDMHHSAHSSLARTNPMALSNFKREAHRNLVSSVCLYHSDAIKPL